VNEVTVLGGAEIELRECYARLAESDFNRAQHFDRVVERGFVQLGQQPRSGSLHIGQFRRLLLRPYPIALFYTIEGARVFIQAVLDVRQNPALIRRRLGL
jgi:plasmid stabilization system protein ParE